MKVSEPRVVRTMVARFCRCSVHGTHEPTVLESITLVSMFSVAGSFLPHRAWSAAHAKPWPSVNGCRSYVAVMRPC